ncbi:hypothetical protein [Burkholderia ubonensis]|uniref:hypothetical protein n=1 Tax=Burkholderia ubonensis TaxID=101571 RepID=UPI0012F8AB5F|nr:hypothetical protein [Burkholderia ubonensis]
MAIVVRAIFVFVDQQTSALAASATAKRLTTSMAGRLTRCAYRLILRQMNRGSVNKLLLGGLGLLAQHRESIKEIYFRR